MIFDEVAHELRDVAKALNLEVILAEESEKICGHISRLLQGTGPAVHHGEDVYIVRCTNEGSLQIVIRDAALELIIVVIGVEVF